MNHKHLSRYLKIGLLLIFVTTSGCKNPNSQPSNSQIQDNLAVTSDGFVQDPNTQNQSKPFKYTITTDLENDSNLKSVLDKLKNEEGSITVDITVDSMDGKYPIKYDLDCEGDGEYEFKGLTESHYCKYKLNSGKHQIWVRGEIPAMRLCSPEFEYSSYSASVYDIYIERWRKNGQVVISVDDWGDIPFRTMSRFAMHCFALKQIPANPPVLNEVTDLSYMFAGANSFNQPLENWDVSKVTNMSWMFHQAVSFDQPLENWDVSHVT
ncbi:MAG: BspA family leucine-rich repeat surface protein, partial [Proteobacteria bacterium]|nr:BspA family leucine-rich repeat surface protein [Pseudomonadota bacterium]